LLVEGEHGAPRQGAAERQHAVDIGMGEQQVRHRLLGRRNVVVSVRLGEDLDLGMSGQHGVCALAAIVADRDAGWAVEHNDVALAAHCLHEPIGRRAAPLQRVGVDLGGDLVGVDEAVEVDDRNALGAGVCDHAAGRRRGTGDQDDRVDVRVDHRPDLLDLGVCVALGVGGNELRNETLLLELVDFLLDRALGLLHPCRDRINVGPADRIRRLAVAFDAFGGRIGLSGRREASREAETEDAGGVFQ